MLAPRSFPRSFRDWNAKWRAPFGRTSGLARIARGTPLEFKLLGPFAYQTNNSTRAYEYPWAYQAIRARGKGLRVVEVGGSLSGLQFVLAREGDNVTNVDPGKNAAGKGWGLDRVVHQKLCKAWSAPVRLVETTIDQANLANRDADVVVAISALEHFAPKDISALAAVLPQVLRPGGVFVATVDLFLDLMPFTRRPENIYGANVNVMAFLEASGLRLIEGNPAELFGFPEFDPQAVLANLSNYMLGTGYPCLAQCFVAMAS